MTGPDGAAGGVVAWDTNCFIYVLRGDAANSVERARLAYLVGFLKRWESGRSEGLASTVALTEVLAGAMAPEAAQDAIDTLRAIRGLRWVDVDASVAIEAGKVRARTSACPMDAIHLATAKLGGASSFLTNDRQLASKARGYIRTRLLDEVGARLSGETVSVSGSSGPGSAPAAGEGARPDAPGSAARPGSGHADGQP